ncbi:hypothetical protein Ga0466249_005454, partial [Sporomusaceae bacterium BoRhaA]|nr:hypothetical protein [Pelorhabdus rhamnosifermentans]
MRADAGRQVRAAIPSPVLLGQDGVGVVAGHAYRARQLIVARPVVRSGSRWGACRLDPVRKSGRCAPVTGVLAHR